MNIFEKEVTGNLRIGNEICESNEINNLVNKISTCLCEDIKSNKNSVIAIAVPRCKYLIAAILASLRTKVTYLLIDVYEQPIERINYMLENSNAKTVFSLSNFNCDFGDIEVVNIDLLKKMDIPTVSNKTNDIAYILYTSGTTGVPKGVEVTRSGLFNFAIGIQDVISFEESKTIASFTNQTFDIFFLEAIIPLFLGMTVILATVEERKSPRKMMNLLKNNSIQMIQFTPSRLRLLKFVDSKFSSLSELETIMVGGESFPIDLLNSLQENSKAKIYNMYGPTETTIWSTVADLSKIKEIPIGSPIINTDIYLINERNEEANLNEEGEIYIAGSGLAKGYCNNPEQTNKNFISLPIKPYCRAYKTGDIGKYDATGKLIFIGRKDNQIKIHGHRVELEEIELHLNKMKEIGLAIVCYDDKNDCLITFYTSEKEYNNSFFINYLKNKILAYMIPDKFYLVEKFLYTSSGKLDKKAVLENHRTNFINNTSILGVKNNDIENKIITLCANLLELPFSSIDISLSPEELGFNSINYIELIAQIEDEFEIEFADEELNISDIADLNLLIVNCKKMIKS